MNSQVLDLAMFSEFDYLQLMLLGGFCRYVDVLELLWVVDELSERASFQMAHVQSRRWIGLCDFVEHASLQMAHA